MGGGLMQLVAYGAQDIFLTGNPQITFFKVVYRRHTNFSVESIAQVFNGSEDFGKRVTCTVSRTGDLIHSAFLRISIDGVNNIAPTPGGSTVTTSVNGVAVEVSSNPSYNAANQGKYFYGTQTDGAVTLSLDEERWIRWSNYLGHRIIKTVEVEIGGTKIDKHYGEWLHIWNQLTLKSGHESGYSHMIGNTPEALLPRTNMKRTKATGTGNKITYIKRDYDSEKTIPGMVLNIPLQFWFCRNPGLALPLIALQYHEVKFNFEFRDLNECLLFYKLNDPHNTTPDLKVDFDSVKSSTPAVTFDAELFIDYIYLDTDERRRFAQLAHEYLIEQVQFTGEETITSAGTSKVKLAFNHPVKELIWVIQKESVEKHKQWFNYTSQVDPDIFSGNNDFGNQIAESVADMLTIKLNNSRGTSLSGDTTLSGGLNANTMFDTPGSVWGTGFDNLVLDSNGNIPATRFGGGDMTPWSDDAKVAIRKSHNNVNTKNNCKSAKIQLNGQDRFSEREGDYFNYVQPYQHHSRTPAPGINVYSFALRPEEHQPSGTCNFSRIDNATLMLNCHDTTFKTRDILCKEGKFVTDFSTVATNASYAKVRVYATNYNVLRIMSGMGGLAYSN